jgi:hypothetical protein
MTLPILEAATKKGRSFVYVIDLQAKEEARNLLALAYWYGEHAEVPVGIELRLHAIPDISFEGLPGLALSALPAHIGKLPAGDKILDLRVPMAVDASSCIAIRLSEAVAATLPDFTRITKLPVILGETERSPAQLKRLFKAGAVGVTVSDVLAQAFTAGLRSGLHNREANDPSTYLKPGCLAVRECVASYLHYLS